MPKLSGFVSPDSRLAAPDVPKEKHEELAFNQGVAIADLQRLEFSECAVYDSGTRSLRPMRNGYFRWAQQLLLRLFSETPSLSLLDLDWISDRIERFSLLSNDNFRPVLCHSDFHNSNHTVQLVNGQWMVTGLFDLTSCHVGHPWSDLARQFCMYVEVSSSLAVSLIDGYLSQSPPDVDWQGRLEIFIVHDRLKYWGFGIRRQNAWWDYSWNYIEYVNYHLQHVPN